MIVDDGAAIGTTAEAACRVAIALGRVFAPGEFSCSPKAHAAVDGQY